MLGLMAAVDAEAVRVCGGVRLVVRAMQSHQQDVGVVAEALGATLALMGAKDSERAQVAVIEAGGAAEVVAALRFDDRPKRALLPRGHQPEHLRAVLGGKWVCK